MSANGIKGGGVVLVNRLDWAGLDPALSYPRFYAVYSSNCDRSFSLVARGNQAASKALRDS